MSSTESLDLHQTFANDLTSLIQNRIAAATPVEVLSRRGDKLLQVLEESDGNKVVTRSFRPEAVSHVEHWYGLSFEDAWKAMYKVFSGDVLGVVPSVLLQSNDQFPFVAISEYIEGGEVIKAPTEFKVKLAHSLGQLLHASSGYAPAPEMINRDMFKVVRQPDGAFKALLVDIDPYVARKRIRGADVITAHYINKLAEMFWSDWCREEEREEVLRAVVRSIGDIVLDNMDTNPETIMAFSNLHLRSQGIISEYQR